MVEGGMRLIKYALFAFNLVFFLAGLGLIIAGAVVQTRFTTYFDFFGGSFSAAAVLLIFTGMIIFVIGFFGCFGAYKEHYCMTMAFAGLLGLVFVLEIAGGLTAYVLRNQVHNLVQQKMRDTMARYDLSPGVKNAWDTVQHDFSCCGIDGYMDWSGKNLAAGPSNVPDSCCLTRFDGCGKGKLIKPTDINREGCIIEFVDWIKANVYVVGGIAIGVTFIQLVGIMMACCLSCTIKKQYEIV